MINIQDIDFDELINYIFKNPPKKPFENVVNFNVDDVNTLFQSLLTMFAEGSKILFGTSEGKVNIRELKTEDIQLLNSYFNSLGLSINIRMFHVSQYIDYKNKLLGKKMLVANIDNQEYDISKYNTNLDLFDVVKFNNCQSPYLKDRRLQLLVEDDMFILNFSPLEN